MLPYKISTLSSYKLNTLIRTEQCYRKLTLVSNLANLSSRIYQDRCSTFQQLRLQYLQQQQQEAEQSDVSSIESDDELMDVDEETELVGGFNGKMVIDEFPLVGAEEGSTIIV